MNGQNGQSDVSVEHTTRLTLCRTKADKVRYVCDALRPQSTGEAIAFLMSYGVVADARTERPYVSSVVNAWRRERDLGDTGEQVRMSPDVLAEFDARAGSRTHTNTNEQEPLLPAGEAAKSRENMPENIPAGEVSAAVRWTTRGAVAVVAVVAAAVSYAHMVSLALHAGEAWRAWLLPLSVDGLIVAASMSLLVAKRRGERGGWLAWLSMWVGVAVSLSANVAAAAPTLEGRLVAAWPPLALLLGYELLMRQVGARATGTRGPASVR